MKNERIVVIEECDLGSYCKTLIRQADEAGHEIHIFSMLGNAVEDITILLTAAEECGFKVNEFFPITLISSNANLCNAAIKFYGRIFRNALLIQEKGIVRELDSKWFEEGSNIDGYRVHEVTLFWKDQLGYIVYEPFVGHSFVIDETERILFQVPEKVKYEYPYLEEVVVPLKQMIQREIKTEDIVAVYKVLDEIAKKREQIGEGQFGMFLIELGRVQNALNTEWDHLKLIFISFLIAMTKNGKYLDDYNEIVLANSSYLSLYNKYFYWRQQWRMPLKYGSMKFNGKLGQQVYNSIYQGYQSEIQQILTPINVKERNKDRVVVIVIQFLEEEHAPTRTALERCATLAKMGKEVLIINTCEQATMLGMIPIFGMEEGRIFEQYCEMKTYQYQNEVFAYYQPKQQMPELEESEKILNMIKDWNPYLILTMGAGSIVSDLAANIAPVINIPLAFSTIMKKENQFTSVGKKISPTEWSYLLAEGYNPDTIIEGTFTFDIKPQTHHYSREEFNLPKDKFLLLVVGLRLDYEIQGDFVLAMKPILEKGAHLVFAGYFDKYNDICKEYPFLVERSSFIGYQKDILAINELIDLYVNPRRLGGGFSIAEAFYKGKPGVTIQYGDVAAAAGPEFCVATYEEMTATIKRYMTDKSFYMTMVEKGTERVKELTDSGKALLHILNEAEKRSIFF